MTDRAGNQWAWWGDPDADGPGLVVGSHLDSVPDGGAFDGPLGVVSRVRRRRPAARARVRARRGRSASSCFADEEGARFGVACAGSRLLTGALDADRARGPDATPTAPRWPRRWRAAGHDPAQLGRDDETLRRVGTFVELHVEQGRGLVDAGAAGRRRPLASGRTGAGGSTCAGEANHAGTTRLADRDDPMLGLAAAVAGRPRRGRAARRASPPSARCGSQPERRQRDPVAGHAPGSTPAAPTRHAVAGRGRRGRPRPPATERRSEESWTAADRRSTPALRDRLARRCSGDALRLLPTGAGHDAGILAAAGVPTAMLFVRNPTGVSHSPGRARRDRRLPRRRRGARAVLVDGRWRDDVLVRARLAAGDGRSPPACGSRVGRRARSRPSSAGVGPRRATDRLPGLVLPGLRQRALARLPPGAARADRTTGGGTFWTWRERMYAVAGRLDPDSYLALARATYAEMVLAGVTCVGEFHYLHHAPGGAPLRRPERDGRGAASRPPRDAGHPAHPARHLLPRRRARRAGHLPLDGVQRAVLRRRRRRAGPTGSSAAAATRPGVGSAPPSTRCAPCRPTQLADRAPRAAAGRPLHVHVSEQPAENEAVPGRPTAARRPGCCTSTACSARRTTAVHATHLTDDDIALLGAHRHGGLHLPDAPSGTSPTASARPAAAATPARRCAWAATSTR